MLTRRSFLHKSALGAAALTTSSALTFAHEQQHKPNIIFILCDDMGYGDLGCFDHPDIKSPNLDGLASEGMKLTQCYAPAPVCSPARAGFMTGRIPQRTGIYDYIKKLSDTHLHTSELTIAELLKSVGYETCFVGKWHLCGKFRELTSQPMPSDQGFDYYMATENNAGPNHLNPGNFVRNGVKVGQIQGYSSDIIAAEALDWLQNKRDESKPYFLFVSFHSPHEYIKTAQEYKDMYSYNTVADPLNHGAFPYRKYWGNITQMDNAAGQVLSYLDTSNTKDSTFIMFTSDNGPETYVRYSGAFQSVGSTGGLRGRKLELYEGGIRVPGIIRWPGHVTAGSTSHEPLNGVDLLPTLCDISGAEIPTDRAVDGVSLLPVFSGNSLQRSTPLYWQFDQAKVCEPFTVGEWPTCDDHAGEYNRAPTTVIRRGDWKLLAWKNNRTIELYNLKDDPAESRDLSSVETQRAQDMLDALIKLKNEVSEEGRHNGVIIRDVKTLNSVGRKRINGSATIDLVSLAGRTLQSLHTRARTVNLQRLNLPGGVFIVKVNGRFRQFAHTASILKVR
ncbi:MAG: sulfatase-like hydrolase/transferase [Chitinivibrionales bacterium]|nr:sulfatase-like hydrolase/transferase [Chitinivibrionales bacterium]